ncbi:MAG: enoyl-CoA hydratase/isomerase family protein [Ketobacter sp.]|nr:MAG: enoyl-CoA hydratase/isomerase family protein [Ketobacter sp.]
MTESILLSQLQDNILWLTMNQPDNLNSLGFDLVAALRKDFDEAARNDKVRVVVLTGEGRGFCAGADLKTMTRHYAPGEPDVLDCIVALFDELRCFPKPVIAAVNGIAAAGGTELMLCCDLIYAARSAKVGDAHCNYGIVPGGGGAAILPRILPAPVAKYLLFTGELMPAETLAHYGLFNAVVDDDQLLDQVGAVANVIASKSPIGLRRTKQVANEALDKTTADAILHERLMSRDQFRSRDYQEGLKAFLEKRKPDFHGY